MKKSVNIDCCEYFSVAYSLLKSGVETRKLPSTLVDLVPLQLFCFWVDFLCYFALFFVYILYGKFLL